MKSLVVKRSIVVEGHKTSVSLEQAFWNGLKEIASIRKVTLSELVGSIDAGRDQGNLSSAIRLFVLDHYRALIASPAEKLGDDADKSAPVGPTSLRVRGTCAGYSSLTTLFTRNISTPHTSLGSED